MSGESSSQPVDRKASGVAYSEKLEGVPEYNGRDGDHIIDARGSVKKGSLQSNNNASIVLGRDRGLTGTVLSGYGGLSHDRVGSIDLVVGRMSPAPRKVSPVNGQDYRNDPIFTYVHASREKIKIGEKVLEYFTDAARIYISQKTDVDFNFRITAGRMNPSPAKYESPASAICLQADDLRFVSRRGIKIVTLGSRGYGDVPIQLSHGSRVTKVYGIDLIAGNGKSANGDFLEQEPLVKGRSLAHCLNELATRVEEIQDSFFKFMKDQVQLNSYMMNHTHGETFCGSISLWSPSAQGACAVGNINTIKNAFSQMHSGMNLMKWRTEWLGLEIKNTAIGETNYDAGASAKFNSQYNSTN